MFLNYFSRMDNWPIFKLNGMKNKLILWGCLIISAPALSFDVETATVKLHDDLNAGDSAAFFGHFYPNATLYNLGPNGPEMLELKAFSPVLKKFKNKEYREDFTKIEVRSLESGLISVDVAFNFFINETFAFAGVDHVVWIEDPNGYRIINLYTGALKPKFTTEGGGTAQMAKLDALMDQWHKDVATYDQERYFNFMSSGFIFLGTDPTERWTKEEFLTFCQPYFERRSTWYFTPNWRNWYVNDDGSVAWFEESIATQMEECRGSGVLVRENNSWKIAHYNLSVLIENEKMDKFIKLRKK